MIQPAVSRLTISQPTRLRAARSQTRATDRELGHFIVSIVAAVATEVKRPRSQTPEKALGIVEESPCDAHVLDVSMGHGRDRAVVEEQDLGLGSAMRIGECVTMTNWQSWATRSRVGLGPVAAGQRGSLLGGGPDRVSLAR